MMMAPREETLHRIAQARLITGVRARNLAFFRSSAWQPIRSSMVPQTPPMKGKMNIISVTRGLSQR